MWTNLELVEFLTAFGASVRTDLKELWRRIVFSMAVSNTDDHLRNHGFLLIPNGWKLSPLLDVNPVPEGNTLSLNVTLDDSRIDMDLVIEAAAFFGISKDDAAKQAEEIISVVDRLWRPVAESFGISRHAQNAIAPAFRL